MYVTHTVKLACRTGAEQWSASASQVCHHVRGSPLAGNNGSIRVSLDPVGPRVRTLNGGPNRVTPDSTMTLGFLKILITLTQFYLNLRAALDSAGFFQWIGIENIPKYGLETDL